MSQILNWLSRFNSKERFFLVGHLLGNEAFLLSPEFRAAIGTVLKVELPEVVFAAMDYHLDWLFASLHRSSISAHGPVLRERGEIDASQEDIDFLIAFEAGPTTHIVLIEAKGVTGWTNGQMSSKAARLSKIFGPDSRRWGEAIVPSFFIMSPRQPQRLDVPGWPDWMAPGGKPRWMPLPGTKDLHHVYRCDASGKITKDGEYWCTRER